MDKKVFQELLAEEVKPYKALLETPNNDWIVKGFIDVNKNIYGTTNDTKVVSKVIEIILIPKLAAFAKRNDLVLEFPSAQNFYPDLTFKDEEGNLFAVDFKSSYYRDDKKVNGLTLGSYWGYFRDRQVKRNTDYPYDDYKCHLVLGVLYKQGVDKDKDMEVYSIDKLENIKSVIKHFIFFVQPKWKIASDRPGSGNTRNIGGVVDVDKLVNGEGTFAKHGEEVFDDYWMNFYNAADAQKAGMGKPHYNNLKSYTEYLEEKSKRLKELKK